MTAGLAVHNNPEYLSSSVSRHGLCHVRHETSALTSSDEEDERGLRPAVTPDEILHS